MAHAISHHGTGLFARAFSAIGTALDTIGRALTVNAAAEARLREVNRLQALSDQELTDLGLKRDRIVQHVFRDIIMI